MSRKEGPRTPDGRYFVSRGQFWQCSDPALSETERRAAIKAMMQARRAMQQAQSTGARQVARSNIDAAKCWLGEHGPVWWDDGAPDLHGMDPARSIYCDWWWGLSAADRAKGL